MKSIKDEIDDVDSMKSRRITRRQTMSKRMERGHGLSDSHGGHWPEDGGSSMTQEQRTIRRKAMAKRLEEGKGLSDSHSGKWQ